VPVVLVLSSREGAAVIISTTNDLFLPVQVSHTLSSPPSTSEIPSISSSII
jgi:hypothetical protein